MRAPPFAFVCLIIATVFGCGDPPPEKVDTVDNSCESVCEVAGETRCNGFVVEACSVDADACGTWTQGADCAASGESCVVSDVGLAECVGDAVEESCTDGTRNQDETDVDCGGSLCGACAIGDDCLSDSDCDTGLCDDETSTCQDPGDTCSDGALNQDETDIDCGGSICDACGNGDACATDVDCVSDNCDVGVTDTCLAAGIATCSDGIANQDETDVDCGGAVCAGCGLGDVCLENADCGSDNCDVNGTWTCVTVGAPTCDDGVVNQDESGVDCGGSICPTCANGEGCAADGDCVSDNCDLGVTDTCVAAGAATCVDGLQNQDESDIDCGGLVCGACGLGDRCLAAGDCVSDNCDIGVTDTCVAIGAATCVDGLQNQDESDVDCGGLNCGSCANGGSCAADGDCISDNCDIGVTDTCVPAGAATCVDGLQNQDESDIDCGGLICGPCGVGDACLAAGDCVSDNCDLGVTDTCVAIGAATCVDGLQNQDESDVDCGGLNCGSCANGGNCAADGDCISNNCDLGVTDTCVAAGAATCVDGLQNQGESDIDCGGLICGPCGLGDACLAAGDCVSDNCDVGVTDTCVANGAATCVDGLQNQDETDVDCGGQTCGACGLADSCLADADCASNVCDVNGTWVCLAVGTANCDDGVHNQDESDVDCGGAICVTCADGADCLANADCGSDNCDIGYSDTCLPAGAPTCADGLLNQDESDVDCGGATCNTCADGLQCDDNIDCASNLCDPLSGQCVAAGTPTCGDGLLNQDESDIDCGGMVCGGCLDGGDCALDGDCASDVCDPLAAQCVPAGTPTCGDGLVNQDESDVDCGGLVCSACADGDTCGENLDCTSGLCDPLSGQCVAVGTPTCGDGLANQDETDVDCGGLLCASCADGGVCGFNTDCASNLCDPLALQCVAPGTETCGDVLLNQDETDVDCGGAVCPTCADGGTCALNLDCASGLCDPLTASCAPVGTETCGDVLLNQDETDVDCGGLLCPTCGIGDGCLLNGDCASNLCDPLILECVAPGVATCGDGLLNQDETDVDCGGLLCVGCADGGTCAVDGDCASNLCDPLSASCVPAGTPTCGDGLFNQDETDVDCGGLLCATCVNGDDCLVDGDCDSTHCDPATLTCLDVPTCLDGLMNQDETDIDCGGLTCGTCVNGDACVDGTDCGSGYCDPLTLTCDVLPSCVDGVLNQDESDIDCGGVTCPLCWDGDTCNGAADCITGSCDVFDTWTCVPAGVPTCADGVRNQDETDVDCGGANCTLCGIDDTCALPADCASGICDLIDTFTCVPADPPFDNDEDFETGDFSRFDYVHNGFYPFEIETDPSYCHGGNYCMRTSPFHDVGDIATLELSLSVRQNTIVSFWAWVNSEPGEHYFRFYIDGIEQVAVSGPDTGWIEYSYPVLATGPGGPDRVLTWEYERSLYVDGGHAPWNEVWIDDIDMPDWNTAPAVPVPTAPGNSAVLDTDSPVFEWVGFDPDLDPITYEVQWDTDVNFSSPSTSGEIFTESHASGPLTDDTTYFWRVRAKDSIDYRWSTWSSPQAVSIETSSVVPAYWRQTVQGEFAMNDLYDTVAGPTELTPLPAIDFDYTGPNVIQTGWGTPMIHNITAPVTQLGTPATITVTVQGYYSQADRYLPAIFLDGVDILSPSWYPGVQCSERSKVFAIDDISDEAADGNIEVNVDPNGTVSAGACSYSYVRTQYLAENPGSVTSAPIVFSLFGGVRNWDRIQIKGSGTIQFQVLDGDGVLIPDSAIPNNSVGFTSRTLLLSGLSADSYPVIRLQADLAADGVIEEWSVTGNNGFDWTFENDGDTEGWVAADPGAAPTLDVLGGVLRFHSQAAGTDPNVALALPVPVDASLFTTLEVTLRTSNTFNNDDVTMYWTSNYGGIDINRSFATNAYLFSFQTLVFDLTTVPLPPGQAFVGDVESIRLDPVVEFLDAVAAPVDGWFEIERVLLY